MTEDVSGRKRQMPKGGRKGGTSFPRVQLADALKYAKKLVAKTHIAPQPRDVIFAGVVGAKSGTGNVRISALKQYGFLVGDEKAGYSASSLAKQINAAPDDEKQPLLQKAVLQPAVFQKVFDAFHGDVVTKAKLRQRVIDVRVHPDEAESCVSLYLSSLQTAGLVQIEGDSVTHVPMTDLQKLSTEKAGGGGEQGESSVDRIDEEQDESGEAVGERRAASGQTGEDTDKEAPNRDGSEMQSKPLGPRAVFNVNVTLDSSLDTEKLQKQLELLKRFGAI